MPKLNRKFSASLAAPAMLAFAMLLLCSIALTGCGVGDLAVSSAGAGATGSNVLPGMSGIAMGGFTPIAGSKITLWQTTNAGYPTASIQATALASVTGGSDGSFNFSTKSYSCASGSFLYLTSTGGTVSAGVTNNNLVEIAALGSCSNFPLTGTGGNPNVRITINEVSTIAAAYALNGFMYVDDTNASTGAENVWIGAPANNAAASGSCTGNGSAMTCTAAGLAHAFANAIALSDSVHFDSTQPTGNALTALATNSLGSIPQAEIHALANILGICTNTGGGNGSSGNANATPPTTTGSDGSACGNLFAATATAAGVTPVDTLSAAMNIASNPSKSVSTLFNLIPTSPPFNPTLALRPGDWSIGITYSGLTVGNATTNFGFTSPITAYSITYTPGATPVNTITITATNTLAAGQTVYLSGFPTSTFLNGQVLTVLAAGLSGTSFTANINYPTAVATTTEAGAFVSGPSGTTSGSIGYPVYLALDPNDNVYILSGNTTTSAASTLSTTSAMNSGGKGLWANASSVDGTQGCYPGVIATDTNGNVWNTYAPPSGHCGAAILGRSESSGASTYTFTSAAPYSVQGQASALAFDRYNNLWYARDTSAGSGIMYRFPYAGGAGTYQNYPGDTTTTPVKAAVAADMTLTGTSGSPAGTMANLFSIVIDKYANVFASTSSTSATGLVFGVANLTPNGTPTYTGQGTSAAAVTASNSYFKQTLQAVKSGAIGLDASDTIFASAGTGLWSTIAPTPAGVGTGTVMTGLGTPVNATVSTSTGTTPGTPDGGEFDGNGTFWSNSFTSSGQLFYTTAEGGASAVTSLFYTCYAPGGGTTCTNLTYSGTPATTPGAPSSSTAGPRMLQIDSTGSIWVAAETAGNVIQILGGGAPAWPQLSYAVFATKPQ